ncbi:MAG: proteobacterial dedicated sortase system response regulator [Betaproteobacteria bacterium]|nr:proteobacterial dedicated sortase system response regulator [Betaproteobacteria bacterium]
MSRLIAIVEDDLSIRENYADALRKQGYQVTGYADRNEAMRAFQTRLPNLAIIDIGLADEIDGGFELCRALRGMSATIPIIFLTARDSDIDTVSGLRMGADDYLTKDISLPHLSARIAALFRRLDAAQTPAAADDILERGKLVVDLNRMRVTWADAPVDLTVTELWIVHALARHTGHVKHREQLMRDARMVVDDTTVTSHIKRIRRKFIEVDSGFDCIETVYGMGYRWKSE